MRESISVRGARSVFVAALATGCVWGTASYGQSDADGVKAGVAAYHEALSSLDTGKLEAAWAQDDSVMNVEPNTKTIAVGWDALKKNLKSYFIVFSELKVTQADGPYVQVKGDVARSMGIVNASTKLKNGTGGTGQVFESDVFEKRGGSWLLVSHTAFPVPK